VLFNSLTFLGFFAVVSVLYYLVPHGWRWPLLLITSCYFYFTFQPEYLLLLAYAAAVAYGGGCLLAGRQGSRSGRMVLACGIGAELGSLVVFKYFDFLAGSMEQLSRPFASVTLPRLHLVLPVGLSFFTFSCVSYLIDVHRGRIATERHPGRLAVYVSFFPKLLAGPIERAGPFLAQLAVPVGFDADRVASGLQLMLCGLCKKVVIADRLAVFVDAGFRAPAFQSPVTLLIATYFYAFQIYCDFSGYSDIAIGAARVLGFDLMENFRRPYLARSVPEFWTRRWHLSLMAWWRDYLYIPMGGSRVSTSRRYLNVLVVYLVSGLWHGANWTFVIWGGLNGCYQIARTALGAAPGRVARILRLPACLGIALSMLLTFHLIAFAFIFFRAASLADAVTVISRIGTALPRLGALARSYPWSGEFALSVGLIAGLLVAEAIDERVGIAGWLSRRPIALRWGTYYGLIAMLLVFGVWGLNKFVYMQF